MKVRSLKLKNYKKFHDLALDFTDPDTGLVRDLIVLVGPNGAGKSSVLQAIAALVGTASGRFKQPDDLQWPGFNLTLAGDAWKRSIGMDLGISFSQGEIEATRDFFRGIGQTPLQEPGEFKVINLSLSKEHRVEALEGASAFFQFRGREYAKEVVRFHPEGFDIFRKVGAPFWYTEQRTFSSLTPEEYDSQNLELTIDKLRDRLSKWTTQKMMRNAKGPPPRRDLLGDLEKAYRTVFPGRRFEGPMERGEIDLALAEPWYFLYDGKRDYEISEMSGGERAVFPILFDFANWSINHSFILIDEIELHLHPPMQQALLDALPRLGTGNQFIVTTHSDHIYDMVPESSIIRMEG